MQQTLKDCVVNFFSTNTAEIVLGNKPGIILPDVPQQNKFQDFYLIDLYVK